MQRIGAEASGAAPSATRRTPLSHRVATVTVLGALVAVVAGLVWSASLSNNSAAQGPSSNAGSSTATNVAAATKGPTLIEPVTTDCVEGDVSTQSLDLTSVATTRTNKYLNVAVSTASPLKKNQQVYVGIDSRGSSDEDFYAFAIRGDTHATLEANTGTAGPKEIDLTLEGNTITLTIPVKLLRATKRLTLAVATFASVDAASSKDYCELDPVN